MATTEYTITDADVGRVLDIPDGYLVNLTQTPRPQLKDIADLRDRLCQQIRF